jgi:hypothetical protein
MLRANTKRIFRVAKAGKDYLPRKANAKLDFLGSVPAAHWNAGG